MLLSAGVREAFRDLKAAAFLAVDAHPSGNILPRKMNLIPKWKAGTLRRNISWCLITAPGLAWGSRFAPALNARRSPSGTSATPEVLITSVLDMAKYDVAVDQHRFLTKETQQLAFTPFTSTKGETPPYGLGSGDVLSSPVGMAFLKAFVFPDKFGEAAPVINWQAPFEELKARLARLTRGPYADVYREELQTRTRVMMSVGRRDEARRLLRVYGELYLKPLPSELAGKAATARISEVADNEDKAVEFTLARETGVRVFAQGEGAGGQMYDYGWVENAETGKAVWEMKAAETAHAGGAEKNRKLDATVSLPAGRYRLRYKSDDSHSFDDWNDPPPEINFWGIALYAN